MVDLGGGPESDRLAATVREREHRLTVMIEEAARTLDRYEPASGDVAGEHDQGAAATEGGAADRTAGEGDLAGLRAGLLALTAAVDDFLADPGSDRSLSALDQRLGEVESRLGCQPVERILRPGLARGGLAGRWPPRALPDVDATAEAAPGEPPAPARRESPPLGWGPPVGRAADPGVAGELAVLVARVRRLEGRLRLSYLLLLLTAGLAAFGLWRLHALEAGRPDWGLEPEQRRSSLPMTEPMLGSGQASPLAPRREGLTPDDLVRAPGDARSERAGAASVESPSVDRPADALPAAQTGPGPRDTRSADPAPLEAAMALPPPSAELVSAGGIAGDAPVLAPSPPGAEVELLGGPDAVVLEVPSYAIQLAAFRDAGRMRGYVEERGLAERVLYGLSSAGGSRWYVLVQGFYPTRAEAQAAADALPEALKRLDPWIRQFPAGSRFERFERGGGRARADASTARP